MMPDVYSAEEAEYAKADVSIQVQRISYQQLQATNYILDEALNALVTLIEMENHTIKADQQKKFIGLS